MKHKMKLEDGEVLLREGLLKFPEGPGDSPRLIGSRCTACGDVAFPRKYLCGKCASDCLEEVLLGPEAELHSYTIVRQATPLFEVPYILGIVKFPEDDELLVLGQLRDCPEDKVKIGMRLELIIDQVRMSMEGDKVIGYVFRPLESGEKS